MIFKDERFYIGLFLVTIGVLTGLDIFEDLKEGTTFEHIALEFIIAFLSIGVFFYLVYRIWRKRQLLDQLSEEKKILEDIASQYEQTSKIFITGLGHHIDQEFERWSLTPSEREVSLLILKGLSNAEIAKVRGASETTVRHQTSAIYKKTGLRNKQELMAYFLEDLLTPGETLSNPT